jgi:hypothetical protein
VAGLPGGVHQRQPRARPAGQRPGDRDDGVTGWFLTFLFITNKSSVFITSAMRMTLTPPVAAS